MFALSVELKWAVHMSIQGTTCSLQQKLLFRMVENYSLQPKAVFLEDIGLLLRLYEGMSMDEDDATGE